MRGVKKAPMLGSKVQPQIVRNWEWSVTTGIIFLLNLKPAKVLWSWIFELLPLLLLTRHPFLLMLLSLRSFKAMKEERFALPHLDATFHLILCCHCNGAQAATIHVFGGKLQGSNTLFGKQEVFLRQSALSLRCSWSLWDDGHKGRWRMKDTSTA